MDYRLLKRNQLFKIARDAGLTPSNTDTKGQIIDLLEAHLPSGDAEPVRDPSVSPSRPIRGLVEAADPPDYENPVDRILRPSKLRELIAEATKRDNPKATDAELAEIISKVDSFRFLRHEGLPAPRRKYRVSLRTMRDGGTEVREPNELEAVDESEAKSKTLDKHRIAHKERHRWNATIVVLEE